MGRLSSLGASSQLSLGRDLSSRRWVLELGLSVDDISVASGSLPDLGLGNDQQHVLGSAEGDPLDSRDALETKTFESLSGLSLGSGLDVDDVARGVGIFKGEVLDGHGGCGMFCWNDVEGQGWAGLAVSRWTATKREFPGCER